MGQVGVGQNRFGIPFWGRCEPIVVGIGMFTGGTGVLTRSQVTTMKTIPYFF